MGGSLLAGISGAQAPRQEGKKSFLNKYGATHEAESFAVITEEFFNNPEYMKKKYPPLYGVLKDYYRQDPLRRV